MKNVGVRLLFGFGLMWLSGSPSLLSGQNLPEFLPDSIRSEINAFNMDTVQVQYYTLDDISERIPLKDSTLNNYYHHYDPVKRRAVDYLNLGNAGSAATPMRYESNHFVGFNTGMNAYSIYNYQLSDFRFFDNNIPFTDVSFTPVSSQQNFVVTADFARNFDDGTSLTVNYRRISQNGFYQSQNTKTTNFGAALRYQSDDGKYTGFLTMISNVNEEAFNGGIVSEDDFQLPFASSRENIPVKLSGASLRNQQKWYSLINYYDLFTNRKNGWNIKLRYDLMADLSYFKYADVGTSTALDSSFYQTYNIEPRGIRMYNDVNRYRNAAYIYLDGVDETNMRIGLIYDGYTINQDEASNEAFNNLMLDFRGNLKVFSGLRLLAEGQMGIWDGAGDFKAKGTVEIKPFHWLSMRGGLEFFRHTPSLVYRSLWLNQTEFYSPEWSKPIGSSFFAEIDIPKLKSSVSLRQNLVDGVLFFNDSALPDQYDGVWSVSSLVYQQRVDFWKLHSEHTLMLQAFNDNIFHLPTLFSKHNIYLEGFLFDRVLKARLGGEIRLTPTYDGMQFMPVTGQFFQGNEAVGFYPMTDAYITGQIQSFRFFLRVENVLNYFVDDIYYQIIDHPQFDAKVRFGVRWQLYN